MTTEKYLALELVAALADRFGPGSKVAKEVPGWIEYLTDVECPERPRNRPGAAWWGRVRGMLEDVRGGDDACEENLVRINAARLGQHFGLTGVEARILEFFASYHSFDMFEHVVDRALQTQDVTLPFLIAQFAGTDYTAVRAALRPDGRLRTSGLLQNDGRRWSRQTIPYTVSDRLAGALRTNFGDIEELVALLFPPAPPPEAEWGDFTGMGDNAEIMRKLLQKALAEGTPGVNILLYGPPGTGKTEFCKVLARELGASLRAVGEADDSGEEPSRGERLAELGIAGRMLASRRDTVLLLDEMEDLFGGAVSFPFSRPQHTSKVFANRLLETNPVPTLWTTNSVEACDPAFLRRMTFSAEMRPPAGPIRKRIWQRLADRHVQTEDAAAITALAEVHDHAPALVADAMRVVRACCGGIVTFEQVLGASAKLTNGGVAPPPRHHSEASWVPALANTDTNLTLLEARLDATPKPLRLSFCLDGPAGTGKSAWARHLARQLGLPVIEKRASDLLSMWVGGTEKAIARAFADARAEGALLIFDEADSLLADRRNAAHQWEVSQVNEMLTWMESHPLPFVCTTNLVENLDPATQRRFTFRIRFDWLRPDQLAVAWRAHFKPPVPEELTALDRLAPGDFANVARRMRALGQNDAPSILVELRRESEAKEGKARPIGFGR
ncbi:AAA family ATPase [Paracoccus marinus]|uniref:AAA family ATPase n=1 Tax=Paracoccus marinus TaxID=288426 RepID=UPI00103F1BEA|nr:ATP-binding protein [Paracoccus marinus]GLS81054.1 ATPase [Paracoccus marinus]